MRHRVRAEDLVEKAEGRSPRFAHGAVPAGKRERPKVRNAPKVVTLADERFTAPEHPVDPVTGAVPRETQHVAREAVLGHARCDVSVMVLHAN